ncbi:MAG TPA: hypothetical protein VHD69_02595 [Candidatus Paceibacterota bacterium]|nr:hypothetical protein [Candidatus Paceibacterota bacterium]
MTPEERDLLQRTYELAEENSDILRKINRSQRASTIGKFIYWGVIIALSFGAYYFIQPYVDTLKGSIGDITGNNDVVSGFGQF